VSGNTAAEKVVNTYRSNAADIDVGFWNLEQFTSDVSDAKRLKAFGIKTPS
jgi:hypothetical protein